MLKFRREGAEVEIVGLNEASATIHDGGFHYCSVHRPLTNIERVTVQGSYCNLVFRRITLVTTRGTA